MKRMERSYAYRGVLVMIVGAVICIPGAVMQWLPFLFGMENSRNVRPMVVKVSLGAGLVLVLLGFAYVVWCWAKWRTYRKARRKGKQVQAQVLGVEADYSSPARGKPAYIVRCLYTDENGKKHMFRSPPLNKDPAKRLQETVQVWYDADNRTCHYVDVAASLRPYKLPKRGQATKKKQ